MENTPFNINFHTKRLTEENQNTIPIGNKLSLRIKSFVINSFDDIFCNCINGLTSIEMYFEFLLIPNSFAPRPHVVVAYFVDKIFATDFIAIDIERICRVKT